MVKQDLTELGFKEGTDGQEQVENLRASSLDESRKNERGGFISGLPTKRPGKSS